MPHVAISVAVIANSPSSNIRKRGCATDAATVETAAQQAFDDGFLGRQMPDLSRLYDLSLLNLVLAEKGRKAMQ